MTDHNAVASILITGGYGCIGAETTKWLLRHTDSHVTVCSRQVSQSRTASVFADVDRSRLRCVAVDVREQAELQQLLTDHKITHVAHLAGLQTPDCNQHRDLGMQINLGGTQNLIEAMKASGLPLQRYVFASSVAVYGPRASYPTGVVPVSAVPQPVNVYGAWKLAGEVISRLFAEETGVPTISVRPGALFGPGRDAGLTATPTTALKHVAKGLPYQIPYRSRQDYLYAPDVGAAVAQTLVAPFSGYDAFTLRGHSVNTRQFVDALSLAVAELGIEHQITIGTQEVPFICDLDEAPFCQAFPKAPLTDLQAAIKQSLEVFQQAVTKR